MGNKLNKQQNNHQSTTVRPPRSAKLPVIIDDDVGSGYMGHGGFAGVSDVAREIPLKIVADDHVGQRVKGGERAGLDRMPTFVAV